jgi:hypothetical protein
MRRIQFFEIHEQSWFPPFLRDFVTHALQSGLELLNAYAPIEPILRSALDSAESRNVIDLCSGGGGPWLDVSQRLNRGGQSLQIRLSDKYPNIRAFQNASAFAGDLFAYCSEPVDAMKVPRALTGFRTIFSSYHHFPPDEARAVLQDAVDAGESIGIFEITRRAPSAMVLMFPWALLVFVTTLRTRPFHWSRLFWTYVVPVIPFVVLFDGVVSCLRTYRPQELREIIGKLTGSEYEWSVGEILGLHGKIPITYVIGRPRKRVEAGELVSEISSAK